MRRADGTAALDELLLGEETGVLTDASGEVSEDRGGKALLRCVDGSPADAEVQSEAGHEDPLHGVLLQQARQSRVFDSLLAESRVSLGVPIRAFADEDRVSGDLQVRVQLGSERAFHAVHRPQHLQLSRRCVEHRLERLAALVVLREGEVVGRVRVEGVDHERVLAAVGFLVDALDDLERAVDGQGASLAEVVLHIDDDETSHQ